MGQSGGCGHDVSEWRKHLERARGVPVPVTRGIDETRLIARASGPDLNDADWRFAVVSRRARVRLEKAGLALSTEHTFVSVRDRTAE